MFILKQFFIVIFLLLFSKTVCSQNVIDYYKGINKAKVFAIENEFDLAIESYKQTFKSCDFAFARDCYNAIELSSAMNDSVSLNYFLQKAICLGIKISDIETAGLINGYENAYFYQRILQNADSLENEYIKRVNWQIRAEINQMFYDDQKKRDEYYAAHFFKRHKIKREWEQLNKEQVEKLIQITKKHGFPGERLIGLDRTSMHLKAQTSNYSAGMPIVILIHYYSSPNPSFDYLLLNEVKKGNIFNEHFATICDFESKFGKGKYDNLGGYGIRFKAPKGVGTDALNMKREEIGILNNYKILELNRVNELTKFWNRLY